MNRCIKVFLISLTLLAGLVHAQGLVREAPRDVKHGHITITTPPEIVLDGKPDRLSPGVRIHDLNNMVVLSASLAGKTVPVVYQRDSTGLVHEAWILTSDEDSKLGGASDSASGGKRFAELLNLIFGTRR
jgi:hypothetical protein